MNKSQRNIILGLLVIIYLLIVYIFFEDTWQSNNWMQNSVAIACSILAPIIVFFIDGFLRNIGHLKLYWQTKIIHRKEKIRFSMSYVYRIHVNDKFLLVKNSKWDFYQPVGGVYKINAGEEKTLIDTLELERDKKMNTTGLAKNDLRVMVPARNVLKFLDWFKSGKNREISHWREFYEELIQPDILSIKDFPHIEYRYAGTVQTPLNKNKKWNCYEINSYDVYDLSPNAEQMKVLEELLNKGDSEYLKWADEKLIQNLGFDERTKTDVYDIGKHTKWALNMKYI